MVTRSVWLLLTSCRVEEEEDDTVDVKAPVTELSVRVSVRVPPDDVVRCAETVWLVSVRSRASVVVVVVVELDVPLTSLPAARIESLVVAVSVKRTVSDPRVNVSTCVLVLPAEADD